MIGQTFSQNPRKRGKSHAHSNHRSPDMSSYALTLEFSKPLMFTLANIFGLSGGGYCVYAWLSQDGSEPRSARLGSGVGQSAARISLYVICCLKHRDTEPLSGSPWSHLHVVGMLRFMSAINQPSLPTPFILFLCLFLSLWPFQLYFIP